jgi:integrating conjugative element membrane protein (TIGR03747 family)
MLSTPVALGDGFVQRDLRRWGGGRESAFVCHWTRRWALLLLVLSWLVCLALPFTLHPAFVILPFATLSALSTAVTASSLKKCLQSMRRPIDRPRETHFPDAIDRLK